MQVLNVIYPQMWVSKYVLVHRLKKEDKRVANPVALILTIYFELSSFGINEAHPCAALWNK